MKQLFCWLVCSLQEIAVFQQGLRHKTSKLTRGTKNCMYLHSSLEARQGMYFAHNEIPDSKCIIYKAAHAPSLGNIASLQGQEYSRRAVLCLQSVALGPPLLHCTKHDSEDPLARMQNLFALIVVGRQNRPRFSAFTP